MQKYLETMKPFIDINAKDEDGTTPLIYAACFGKYEIAQALLQAGAKVDSQDSPLVKLLIEHGASSQTRSAKGRTVFDFVKSENSNKIADILANNPRDSISSTASSVLGLTAVESITSAEEEEEEEEDLEVKDAEFDWDNCMPDQMFVFAADDLPYILDTVISNLTLPVRNVQEIFLPANVVFLSARFAHYYSSLELAEQLLEGALDRISKIIKSNTDNVHILSYWMTNITRLLFYLKKDTGLVVTTANYQLKISELISETYNYMVHDTEKRLHEVLELAMLEYDPIKTEEVNFTDDYWQRLFKRRSTTVEMQRNSSIIISPQSITSLLSCTLYVLQSYEIHSAIIIQALAQFFHFISCELFNQMLTQKKYLCRSKAIQVRMNLSVLEEWIRNNNLPSNLLSYLKPSIQLVQLLQCITQLDTLQAMSTFDALNPLQIRRCIMNYRYETNEQKISDEIQLAVGHRKTLEKIRPTSMIEQHQHQEEEEEQETKDSKFMLPFFVPTATQLSALYEKISPVIPQDWMERLDKTSSML
ncbi:hypothetical protein BCV72DRAFT_200368 [Rhizopus microsporus var. microsporus]|uniref:Dilute domain-containing protein n=1 Tax=Rhizopus microsporus var. microsporus TaxID=86635 RepID=A0A1X0RDL4_RHIZD|nr:hypothetical protein BCV72DRAFT_200368 [Rhizopus microsporus var. microsporus]